MIKVSTITKAWDIAYRLAAAELHALDEDRTKRAG